MAEVIGAVAALLTIDLALAFLLLKWHWERPT